MHYIVSVYYHYLMQSFVKNCIFSSIFFIKYITTNVEWGLSFSLYSGFFLIKAKISTCKTANMITFLNINSMHITDLLCPLVEKAISNFLHSSYTIIAQAKYRMYFRTNPLSASTQVKAIHLEWEAYALLTSDAYSRSAAINVHAFFILIIIL